jgi:hypothetical protein
LTVGCAAIKAQGHEVRLKLGFTPLTAQGVNLHTNIVQRFPLHRYFHHRRTHHRYGDVRLHREIHMIQQLTSSVRVTVEPTNLIKGLRHAFTETINVASELLSNARRAGASRIDITVDANTFHIVDDGEGISDFAKLIAIGGTDWDSLTHACEAPYGGFLGSLFGASRIRVQSSGQVLEADTQWLLDQQPVDILKDEDANPRGTSITLYGHNLLKKPKEWQALCRGFPVPVVVNGEVMLRNHALDQHFCVETKLGLIHFNENRGLHPQPTLYLQGFEIHPEGRVGFYPETVLHLDPARFIGRFPDRATLVNQNDTMKVIREEMRQFQTAFLTKKKSHMTQEMFATLYAELCIENGDAVLLNDVPMVPSSWVLRLDPSDLELPHEWGHDFGSCYTEEATVAVSELQENFCLSSIIDAAGDIYDGEGSFVPAAFAVAAKLPCVIASWVEKLDRDHPLKRSAVDLSQLTVTICGERGRSRVYLDEHFDVVACDCISITHPTRGTVEIRDFAIFSGGAIREIIDGDNAIDALRGLLLSPIADSDVIRQASRCTSNDAHNDDLENAYRNAYLNGYSIARANPLATQMGERLHQGLEWLPDAFRGKSFVLRIGLDGRYSVGDIKTANTAFPLDVLFGMLKSPSAPVKWMPSDGPFVVETDGGVIVVRRPDSDGIPSDPWYIGDEQAHDVRITSVGFTVCDQQGFPMEFRYIEPS